MLRLSFIIILLTNILFAQSPHGKMLAEDCSSCHVSTSWKVEKDKITFDHQKTNFVLLGQHRIVNCTNCHTSLVFNEAKKDCYQCHKDVHLFSVGNDCAKCHNSNSWLIKDVTNFHQLSRFPLVGKHKIADCSQCHKNYSTFYFEQLSTECYSCHASDYNKAVSPNHLISGYSKDCTVCHDMSSSGWKGSGVIHDFFPLIGGHALSDCYSCHSTSTFSGLNPNCYACHSNNYNNTVNPNHIQLGFPTDCKQCHSIMGWKPAAFEHDNLFFPIYSGKHKNKWNNCSDCHTNSGNYSVFSCINCHEHNRTRMDQEHQNVNGYVYQSDACLDCHPNGNKDGAFNHITTLFPLTGMHLNLNCNQCHQTSTPVSIECRTCHLTNYNNASNPNHVIMQLTTNCEECHTSNGWQPSTFDHSNTDFPLIGAHTTQSCNSCHQTAVTNASSECYSCHQQDYQNTTNPSHIQLHFPFECQVCHNNQTSWTPSQFNHDLLYFPIYSRKHKNKWNSCSDCHTVPGNYTIFSCIDCHEHNRTRMDDKHRNVTGYQYVSAACLNCHPDGEELGKSLFHKKGID